MIVALAEASRAVDAVVPKNPLRDAIARWTGAPWRVVVAGRTSVGKSSLVNRVLGAEVAATGLGGVTAAPTVYRHGDVELVDTPGIDDPEVAALELGPLLDDTDAIVWIVDGLMPVGATERAVIGGRAAVLHVVVGRIDLVEPAERDAVVARVASLCGAAPIAMDLRAQAPALDVPDVPSPRRRRAWLAAIAHAEAAIAALPPPPGRGDLLMVARTAWRREVRELEDIVADEIDRGLVDHKDAALRRLELLAPWALRRFGEQWPHLVRAPLPELPRPAPHAPTGALSAAVAGGAEGALRALKAAAGRWLLEGDAVLADAIADADLPDLTAPRRAAIDALARARAALA